MDFGVLGFDGLMGLASDPETKQKLYGSALGFRSLSKEDDDLRRSKVAKADDFSFSNMTLLGSNNAFSFSDAQELQQMLSFSSPKSESLSVERSCRRSSIPYFHSMAASARDTGYNNGIRRPFTPSQWMELEHQALIYKYIAANVSVPSNLLMPIKKSIQSTAFSSLPAVGWGGFQVRFSGNSDSEPGRCRRTDGKKWRCSKDAMPDLKYCERHMNRGRHRSRKPVEGQAGHSVVGISGPVSSKLISSSSTSTVVSGEITLNSLAILDRHLKNLPLQANRMLMEKDNEGDGVQNASCFSALSSTEIARESKRASSFVVPKQQLSYEATPQAEYGFVSDGFLEPSLHKNSITTKSFGSEEETESRLHHFIWPKNQTDQSLVSTWSGFDTQAEGTKLSMSAMTEKLELSPLRLSREFDPMQMGLGMNETSRRQSNWIPKSWGSSMGGPLGEALKLTNSNGGECSPPAGSSPVRSSPVGSSPTGVLQKTSFGSVSNSSTGSSPRVGNDKIHGGAMFCDDLLGSLL